MLTLMLPLIKNQDVRDMTMRLQNDAGVDIPAEQEEESCSVREWMLMITQGRSAHDPRND